MHHRSVRLTLYPFVVMCLVTAASIGYAHDMWVTAIPGLYRPGPGDIRLVLTIGGAFPQPEFAVPPDRIARSFLYLNHEKRRQLQWNKNEHAAFANLRLTQSGHAFVVVEQPPRYIELTAEQFNEYVQHEGMPHIYELRRARGMVKEPARELYSRYVKALIHAGAGDVSSEWIKQPLGLKIEIVPLADPCAGGTVPIRLLLDGKPLADQLIQYGQSARTLREVKTNKHGKARLTIDAPGLWIVKTIHMEYHPEPVKFQDKTANWVSHWATLTFEVPSK